MVFPSVVVQRHVISGDSKNYYNGLAQKIILISPPSTPSTHQKDADVRGLPEIKKLKDKIWEIENEMSQNDRDLEIELENEVTNKDNLLLLLKHKNMLVNKRAVLKDALERMYEEGINKLIKTREIGKLSTSESEELNKEIVTFTSILDFELENTEKDIKYDDLHIKLKNLPEDVKENCPLIFNIVEALLLTKEDQSTQSEKRVRSTMHALALLLSLHNQKMQNNFRLMFTMLCVSYGAGDRFITMLNHMGLSISWKKFIQFLDIRLKEKPALIKDKTADLHPVILLMDNINMFRGKKKHIRLLHNVGPKMWNFTGRGLLIPRLSEKEKQMLSDKQKCTEPQKDVMLLDCEEIFLENDKDKVKLWEAAVDKYLLEILDFSLNKIHLNESAALSAMSENDVIKWLRTADFEKSAKCYKLEVSHKAVGL